MGKARRQAKQAQTLLFWEIPTENGAFGAREIYTDYAALLKAASETYEGLVAEDTPGLLGWIRVSKVPLAVGAPVEQLAIHPGTGYPVEGFTTE